MYDELQDLKERLSARSSEDLLRMVNIDFADYRKEALDLAREELKRRGYSDFQTKPSSIKTNREIPKAINDQMSTVNFIIFSVVTGLVTLFLFPAISYLSIIVYGLPASIFIFIGYELWFIFRRYNQKMASAFSIGFIPSVVFCLMVLLFMSPLYVGMILLQFSCFWFIHKLLIIRWSKRSLP